MPFTCSGLNVCICVYVCVSVCMTVFVCVIVCMFVCNKIVEHEEILIGSLIDMSKIDAPGKLIYLQIFLPNMQITTC
jgi:hypothetical protein